MTRVNVDRRLTRELKCEFKYCSYPKQKEMEKYQELNSLQNILLILSYIELRNKFHRSRVSDFWTVDRPKEVETYYFDHQKVI